MSALNVSKLFQTAQETNEPETVPIYGQLPSWLRGTYYRVGPSMFDFPNNFTVNHLFDGFAMISKFVITQDNVTFEKKYLKSDAYVRGLAAAKPVITEFGTPAYTDPNKSLLSKVVSAVVPEFTDNDYATLFTLGPDLFAIADTCFFRQIDRDKLGETPMKCDATKIFGVNSQSAHPLKDSRGDVWNIGFTLFGGLKYHVVKIPHGDCAKEMLKNSKGIATFSSRWNGSFSAFHSFGMSENFIVFIEQPYVASLAKLCKALVKRTAARDWLEWRGEEKNRFVLISKKGKVYKTEFYSKESFYYIHVINCFEEDDQVVLDIMTYPDASVLDLFSLKNLRQNLPTSTPEPRSERYIIPLVDNVQKVPEMVDLVKGSGATAVRVGSHIVLTPQSLCNDDGLEFPVLHPALRGKKVKYVYAMGTLTRSVFRHQVCKLNVDTKEVITSKFSTDFIPGEPMFVPDPGGESEDDGVILSALSNAVEDARDCLVFLNKEMEEVARATFTNNIPSAFHGIFLGE